MKRVILLLCICCTNIFIECKKSDPSSKPDWAKKDIRDFSDADLERLYDQWEEDDEPLAPDELPEHLRPPPSGGSFPFDKVGALTPDEIMKMTKKGKTVMMFVNLLGTPTRDECETLTSLWQGSLRNNHIQAERYVIEDARAIFLFHDGSQAWDAKEFLLEQDGVKDLSLEGQVYEAKKSSTKKQEL